MDMKDVFFNNVSGIYMKYFKEWFHDHTFAAVEKN